jgi:hypothetical protein
VPTAHHRYFLKIYFLPELLGGVTVSEVFSQMEGKKQTTTISVKRTKKIVRRFRLSIIYLSDLHLSDCLLAFCQKADRTADSWIPRSVCAVMGSNKKLSLSVGGVDGRECLLRTGSGAVGRFGR